MIDEKLTSHLAELSKIAFTEDELKNMTRDMTDIITLMDKVCDFSQTRETYALDAVNFEDLRNDKAQPSFETDKITANAKKIQNNSFVVPKVV